MKLRITEEFREINRVSGKRSTKQTDEKVFDAEIGSVLEMPAGRRIFAVDTADENSVTVTVRYENNPSANKSWVIAKDDSVFYRPRSTGCGYQYTIGYENDSISDTKVN